MFAVLKYIRSNPMVLVFITLVIFILFMMLNSFVSNMASIFGFNSKENLITREAKTTHELERLIEITEENEKAKKVQDGINKINSNSSKELEVSKDSILDEEKKLLDNIANDEMLPLMDEPGVKKTIPPPVELPKEDVIIKVGEAATAMAVAGYIEETSKKFEVSKVKKTIKAPTNILTSKHKKALLAIVERSKSFKGEYRK